MTALDSCNNTTFVEQKKQLYELNTVENKEPLWTPLLCFSLVAFFIFILSIINNTITASLLTFFDRIFFLSLGILGIVLIIKYIIYKFLLPFTIVVLVWMDFVLLPHLL
jgi:hypothetical protein